MAALTCLALPILEKMETLLLPTYPYMPTHSLSFIRKAATLILIGWPLLHMFWTFYQAEEPLNQDFSGTILVLGNQVYPDSTPSPYLEARLLKGLQLFQQTGAKEILVSGGTGIEGVNEAVVMAEWLNERGVPSQQIMIDSTGMNTWATAQHSAQILGTETSLYVVSHSYHLVRCRMALDRVGFHDISLASAYSNWTLREIMGMLREFPAYYYYYFFHWRSRNL